MLHVSLKKVTDCTILDCFVIVFHRSHRVFHRSHGDGTDGTFDTSFIIAPNSLSKHNIIKLIYRRVEL